MSTAPSAVLLDALGTLVGLEPPGPRLAALLAQRHDVRVSPGDLERALHAEMAHYRANCSRAGDQTSLAELRLECAEVLGSELRCDLAPRELVPTLLDALVFRAYPDVAPALAGLRERGVRTAVVSNWDVSLHDVLARVGLSFDVVVTSAEQGVAKPSPEIFDVALREVGCAPGDAVHVGDSVREDVEGALAAGIEPVLLVRAEDPLVGAVGGGAAPAGVRTIAALTELA